MFKLSNYIRVFLSMKGTNWNCLHFKIFRATLMCCTLELIGSDENRLRQWINLSWKLSKHLLFLGTTDSQFSNKICNKSLEYHNIFALMNLSPEISISTLVLYIYKFLLIDWLNFIMIHYCQRDMIQFAGSL